MKRSKGIKSALSLLVMLLFVVGCAPSNTATTAGAAGKKERKVKPYDPTGVWEYTVETPDGAASGGKLNIIGNPGAYTATLETDQFGALDVNEMEFQGTAMTGNIEVMGNVANIECDFDGDTFSGAIYFGEDVLPIEGKRVSK